MFSRFLKNRTGQTMSEYVLIVGLIALIALVGVRVFGTDIKEFFQNAADELPSGKAR